MAFTVCAECGHEMPAMTPACPACVALRRAPASSHGTRETATYLVLFVLTFAIFVLSPVSGLYDSKYSILLSESILTRHTPNLRGYSIEGLDFELLPAEPDLIRNGAFYQLVRINDKLLYYYPHGSSLLSLPLVAVLRASGEYVVSKAVNYYAIREAQEQHVIAAFLMAILACVFLRTAEIMLPASWSLVVALGASFGTQIWSTASRLLWSHTWEILLLGAVVLELLSAEEKPRRLHMVWLASLVSWMFFVRPTGAVVVVGVTIYIFLYHPRDCLPYLLAGLAWLAGFITYSWLTFGQIVPGYYHNRSFQSPAHFLTALAGNLVSPSRGLLVFVPELLFVMFIVARYWRHLPHRRLAVLAIAVSCAHMLILCFDEKWWGGWSYGPRLSTDVIPWFVLLATLSLRSFRDDIACASVGERQGKVRFRPRDRGLVALACVLLALGVAINARGALSWETALWNGRPNIDLYPERLWDWRSPQFLAGLAPRR